MAPLAAIKPTNKNLFLWLFVAAPLLYFFTAGFSHSPAHDSRTADSKMLRRLENHSGLGGLKLLASAPVLAPDLVTREIFLPRKIVTPPILLAASLKVPSESNPASLRKSRGPRIKRVDRHLRQLIQQAASRHGIDPAMIKAIIMAESSFNPNAVSNRGAQGLMQLMPQTAESLGVADAFDPGKNIDAGARYFRQLLNRFRGDVELALAAYNAGIQNVKNHNGVPPFESTQRYVQKVLTYYKHYKRMLTG